MQLLRPRYDETRRMQGQVVKVEKKEKKSAFALSADFFTAACVNAKQCGMRGRTSVRMVKYTTP